MEQYANDREVRKAKPLKLKHF